MNAEPMIQAALPRASRYDRAWAEANSLGENVLYFAESLCNVLPLSPGMRVIDLGCGHAISSIFLAREFGVTVWAVDRAIDPTANLARIEAMGCADSVFPLRADVRALPLPHGYFDAAVSLDSFLYFGTDERFLPFFARHLKPGGYIGVVDACLSREIESAAELPVEARAVWEQDWWGVHTIDWWRRLWQRTGLVNVLCAEVLPESDLIKQSYDDQYREDPAEAGFIALMEAEKGQLVSSYRLVGQRTDRPIFLEDADTDYAY
ncbi:MAG: SAM-dependent methyltransferase [Chloroflexi bacterium]|nr:SAM-dependent methyltransferase [Chloroflexota bacterium]